MLDITAPVPRDPLFELSASCLADTRPERLDLILGVYRDDAGNSPVMEAVHQAEARMLERRGSKEYVGLSGSMAYNDAMTNLMLAGTDLAPRATAIQAVGGTGALRLVAEFLHATDPRRTLYLGLPAYVNHIPVFEASGLHVETYEFTRDGHLNVEALLETARGAEKGDVILLQGCAHNPTGLTMPMEVWKQLTEVMVERELVAFIDQAYYGLGDGLEGDLAGMQYMLERVPNAVVAVSASKAFSLYSERTGLAMVLTDPARRAHVRGLLEIIARADYSQSPAHGADIVTEILTTPELDAMWRDELTSMRDRLATLRSRLRAGIESRTDVDFSALGEQNGMFLRFPLDGDAMDRLRVQYAIYGLPSGRINLAGIPIDRVDEVAEAVAAVANDSRH